MNKTEFKAHLVLKHSSDMIVPTVKTNENGEKYKTLDAEYLVNYLKVVDKIADHVFKEEK